jgi:hypothetical protein
MRSDAEGGRDRLHGLRGRSVGQRDTPPGDLPTRGALRLA